MNGTLKDLLVEVAGINGPTSGAFNLRVNGKSAARSNSENVTFTTKADGQGMDIHVKPGTKNETVHIPVVIDESGLTDVVINDFHIGEGCEGIVIVAGCGIHNDGCGESRHDGIHSFHIGENAEVLYKETHVGKGSAQGGRVLNPVTNIVLARSATFTMESVQLDGVDATHRITNGTLADNSHLTVTEKLMTRGQQQAKTEFSLYLAGKDCKAGIVSRSVAKDASYQEFVSKITGNNDCVGHSECDAIIMDTAVVRAIPEITAKHTGASLIHEAAIGKIAGEQLMKLMTLGLSENEAEEKIIEGFLS